MTLSVTISQLPAAVLPLSGNELVPMDQNGVTVAASLLSLSGIPQNPQNGNYTTVLTDKGKDILHPNGAGAGDTFTIDSNANVPYPLETVILFTNRDPNNLAIAINTDTLILGGSATVGTRTLAQNGVAIARKVEPTVWIIYGVGLT